MNRIVTRNQFTATFTGRGEFYSGIAHGQRVLLTVQTTTYWWADGLEVEGAHVFDRRQRSSTHLSVQHLDGNSAHLGVKLDELADIEPLDTAS
jgi:hypothetical protein